MSDEMFTIDIDEETVKQGLAAGYFRYNEEDKVYELTEVGSKHFRGFLDEQLAAQVVDVSEAGIDNEYPEGFATDPTSPGYTGPPSQPPVKIYDGVRDTARR